MPSIKGVPCRSLLRRLIRHAVNEWFSEAQGQSNGWSKKTKCCDQRQSCRRPRTPFPPSHRFWRRQDSAHAQTQRTGCGKIYAKRKAFLQHAQAYKICKAVSIISAIAGTCFQYRQVASQLPLQCHGFPGFPNGRVEEQDAADQIAQPSPKIVAPSNVDQLVAKHVGNLRSWADLLADFRQ